MHTQHDSAQKDFFSHKQVITDFLSDYVQQAWVHLVDFESLETESFLNYMNYKRYKPC